MADYPITSGDTLCLCKPDAPEILGLDEPPTFRTKPSRFTAYCYNERTDTLAGPISNPDTVAVTTKDNSGEMLCVNQDKKILKTDLLDLNTAEFPTFEDPFGDIETQPDFGDFEGVIGSKSGNGFLYRNLYLTEPFGDPTPGGAILDDGLYFADSHMAITETNWIHLGDEHNEKQIHRVDLSFHKNSCGHLWMYVQNEEKQYKGQYKGMIKEHMKVFTNLRGRRFRIKMFIATHKNHPWAMREMSIGHMLGKSF